MQETLTGQLKIGAKCGVALSLLAVLFLSTGCFQEDQPKSRNLQISKLGPESIWPLATAAGSRAPSIRSVAAEDLSFASFASEARNYQGEVSTGFGEAFAAYTPYPVGSHAGLMRAAEVYRLGGNATTARGALRSSNPFLEPAAAAFFNKPFGLLFANIFKKTGGDLSALPEVSADDARNPFRDAKKAEPGASAAVTPPRTDAPTPSSSSDSTTQPSDAKAAANSTPSAISVAGSQQPGFVFVGDFDGSGVLKVVQATRVDDAAFSFPDGQRAFSIFSNPSAVDNQRSFGIDDVNGDGIADLLVTSRASLFGGVLLGDGRGDYRLADSFLTAYEPMIATLGQSFNGIRDIVALDVRTGAATTFRAGGHYKPVQTSSLGFLPDYIAHLVSLQDGQDYLMAARDGSPEVLYRWADGGRLENAGQSLPGDPSATFNEDAIAQSLMSSLQIYQIGSYASVTLTNSRGQSFNVANMRLWPNIFLAIGDLEKQGTLDVAVAFLVSSTPNK